MVGDAMGLPYEGLTSRTREIVYKDIFRFHFLRGKGFVSDDTDHMLLTLRAFLSTETSEQFTSQLAKNLQKWLLTLPPGVGFGTLKALSKLWLGRKPSRSGSNSAGNGPCMRATILGALLAEDTDRLSEYVTASTFLTHNNNEALVAALALARTTAWLIRNPAPPSHPLQPIFTELRAANFCHNETWYDLVDTMERCLAEGQTVSQFQENLGLAGFVSGYAFHSAPVALYVFLKEYDNFEKTIYEAVSVGGDTDTIAFMAGSLAGTRGGKTNIPKTLIEGVSAWPCDIGIVQAHRFNQAQVSQIQDDKFPWFYLFLRNLLSWLAICPHIIRRLAGRFKLLFFHKPRNTPK